LFATHPVVRWPVGPHPKVLKDKIMRRQITVNDLFMVVESRLNILNFVSNRNC
jgi:hypothetical protein